jgi:hypothetical protein
MTALGFLTFLILITAASAGAQTPAAPAGAAPDVNALAKATQNPVGDIISVPFQFNFNGGGDLEDQTALNVNFQPVIPFRLSDDWNVIARTIVPINTVPIPGGERSSGIGDVVLQMMATPKAAGSVIWGVGPSFSLPTATAAAMETGTWAAGFSAVVLTMPGPFVLGALVNQLWPLHDEGGDPEMDFFTFQPFVNYNFGDGWALAFAPVLSANWAADSDDRWTVPLGLGLMKTTVFNRRPMTLGIQIYNNATRPAGAAGYQIRFVLAPIFPK